jgi:hypothetical protein
MSRGAGIIKVKLTKQTQSHFWDETQPNENNQHNRHRQKVVARRSRESPLWGRHSACPGQGLPTKFEVIRWKRGTIYISKGPIR